MKSYLKICFSILKKNKAFSAGLFIMALLSVAIAFLGANLGKSSEETITRYLETSGIPDAVITTSTITVDNSEGLGNISGVNLVYPRFVLDSTMKTQYEDSFSIRVFGWNENVPLRQNYFEKVQPDGNDPGILVSVNFAEHNDIHAGDSIVLMTPLGEKRVTVEATVSNPDTMHCQKDKMSAYESYQFGYIFIRNSDFDNLFSLHSSANQWLIYFDADITPAEKADAIDKIRAFFGDRIITESYTQKNDIFTEIYNDIDSIKTLSSFIPLIIWLISLGFSFIFIRIIIDNQRKTIGLLRALGYGVPKTVSLFIGYTVMINLPASMFGIPIGNALLNVCVKLVGESVRINDYYISISHGATVGIIFIILAIGIVSSLFGARTIARIDPSQAYGGNITEGSEPPGFIKRLKTDSFVKISLATMIRSRKRQMISALCISACAVSICIGLEGCATVGYPIKAVYGGRYQYDLMVRSIDEDDIRSITSSVSGISRAEPVTYFTSELFGNEVRVSTVSKDAEMIILTDSQNNRIFPGDGVIIDEMCAELNEISVGDKVTLGKTPLTVTGIAREILYAVIFVSPETAASMGHDRANCLMIKFADGADAKDIERQISDINGGAYFVEIANQKYQIRHGFIATRTVMLILALLAAAIGTLLVCNMSLMDFNEKKVRYATLRALGVPLRRIALISAVENSVRTVAGIIIGCPLCYICSVVLLKLLSNATQQYVMVDFPLYLALSCVIPLAYVFIGVAINLVKISKMDFNQYLNEVE